ncbi:membrane-associated phospholipid phosphatase [Peptoniphilus sp. ING2-D1G]|nr:membrane-associated phospholipid phosphatase [Peptoniphilus sp. ING2-D1G]
MKNPFKSFDDFLINLINKKMSNKLFDFLFYHITNLGGVISLTLLILLLLFFEGKLRVFGIELIVALAVTTAIVQILKRTFTRNRPYWILENLNTYGIDLSDYSFPSGHSAASFSVATVIALNYQKITLLIIFVALLIAISRIYLAVHYPTDVVAGVLIGTLCSLIVHYKVFPAFLEYIKDNLTLGGSFLWY